MRRLPGILASIVAGLLLQPASNASAPVFRGTTELVKLPVTVRDAQGRLVLDLGREDFDVYEDGRLQKLEIFAKAIGEGQEEMLSLDLGLLLDTSESMIDELKLSQEAALRFLDAIPRARELFTIFFDQDIRISRYDSEHQQGLVERILESKGSGLTALYDAIAVYLSKIEDSPGRKVLVLFTDGEDTTSQTTLKEILDLVRSSNAVIYVIDFSKGLSPGNLRTATARAFLHQIGELTGGGTFAPSGSKDLPGIYQKILEELSAQYVLGFASDRPGHGGRFRKLRVEVRRAGLRVRHRQGYLPVVPQELEPKGKPSLLATPELPEHAGSHR